jgi:hypothetical protein
MSDATTGTPIPITDLTQHPPRGFRVRLGDLVILARMLDKGRATLAGKNGDYEYLTSITAVRLSRAQRWIRPLSVSTYEEERM